MEKSEHRLLDPHQWVNKYADELFRFARSKTSNTELAEDLVQETFLAALHGAEKFKGESSERTWLFSILKFKIAGHYRKASTAREITLDTGQEQQQDPLDIFFDASGAWNPSFRPKNWTIDSKDTLENKELADALERCIERLNANQKQLIVLKLIEEIEVEKICKELKLTTTNYWVIIHRAKLQLRACLERNWLKL